MQFTMKRITVWYGHTQLMLTFPELGRPMVLSFSEHLVRFGLHSVRPAWRASETFGRDKSAESLLVLRRWRWRILRQSDRWGLLVLHVAEDGRGSSMVPDMSTCWPVNAETSSRTILGAVCRDNSLLWLACGVLNFKYNLDFCMTIIMLIQFHKCWITVKTAYILFYDKYYFLKSLYLMIELIWWFCNQARSRTS